MTSIVGTLVDGPLVIGLPRPAVPPAGDVDIWFADLDLGLWPNDTEYLDEQEKVRAERFAFADHARWFRRGRQMRRILLAGYLGLGPDRLAFSEEEHGRPFLSGDPVPEDFDFNMSNSHSLAVLAVARGARVGLDLELQRPMPDADPIADRNFHPREAAAVQAESEPTAKDELFFRCWTRKEAVIKALGTGLQSDLQAFFVGNTYVSQSFLARFEAGAGSHDSWWLTDISTPPLFVALASSIRPERINIHRWCRSR